MVTTQPAGGGQPEPQQAKTRDDHEERPADPPQVQLEGLPEQDQDPE